MIKIKDEEGQMIKLLLNNNKDLIIERYELFRNLNCLTSYKLVKDKVTKFSLLYLNDFNGKIRLNYLDEHYHLIKLVGDILIDDHVDQLSYLNEIKKLFYKPRKSLKVLINPVGGKGRSLKLYKSIIKPILSASGNDIDEEVLKYNKHAMDITKTLELKYDTLVCVSGDGCLHEVLNGFYQHADPVNAFRIPVCPVPTGSGNSLSLCILGLELGFNVAFAALNAVNGKRMPLDLFSIHMGDQTFISYLTQCTGLMADLDIGTEHLRWMGDNRFVYGYLRSLVFNNPIDCELYVKVDNDNKFDMISNLRKINNLNNTNDDTENSNNDVDNKGTTNDGKLFEIKYTCAQPDWLKISDDISYIYAGQVPWVSRDLKQFPVALPNDGYIDIAIQSNVSRTHKLMSINGAENASFFFDNSLTYIKSTAYHLIPKSTNTYISIDGENVPLKPYTCEVHKGLANVLSPFNTWNNQF